MVAFSLRQCGPHDLFLSLKTSQDVSVVYLHFRSSEREAKVSNTSHCVSTGSQWLIRRQRASLSDVRMKRPVSNTVAAPGAQCALKEVEQCGTSDLRRLL